MKNFVKFSLLAVLAVSASAASAADLEFHGYARVGLGFNSAGGNQVSFMQSVSGKSKFRLGNEADYCLEPSFSMSFTKLDDKSVWGVSMLPAVYRRMNSGKAFPQNDDGTEIPDGAVNGNLDPYHTRADGGLPVSYKEFYFYGRNVPQLGGGEIWVGRRYFGRNYLGAINDSFLEAQDGFGAGVNDIPVGPAKLHFDISVPQALTDGQNGSVMDTNLSIGAHVTSIPTFNKDSNLQVWARVYLPMQKTSGDEPATFPDNPETPADDPGDPTPLPAEREIGYSVSAMHVAGFGTAGNLTLAGRFDQNAYTDQQDNGSGGKRNIEFNVVYGVNIPAARTSVDALVAWRQTKSVAQLKDADEPADDTMNLFLAGFRTDTQISGPFRFLLEVGYDWNKTKTPAANDDEEAHTLLKITPCLAISGGNDPWSRPTFRLFYTYASWNEEGSGDVFNAWKDLGAGAAFAGETSGGVFGLQAEGWW